MCCFCASKFAPEGQFRLQLASFLQRVGGTECSFVCHVPGPRGISPGYFCPSRESSQYFSQASGASRSQHRLFSFLLMQYGSLSCIAVVGCANTDVHRPTNTRSSFSAPEAVLNEVEQRFDCVQAQTQMYPSFVEGERLKRVISYLLELTQN